MSLAYPTVIETGRESRSDAIPKSGQQTVLFVLNPGELKLFLPDFDFDQFASPDAQYHWLDTTALDASGWQKALNHYRPSVLVTGWSSPAIPEAWALAPDSPLRYVCQITGSVRKAVPRKLVEHGVLVTNWGSLISHTIAEHALLLVLASLRNVPLWQENILKMTPVFTLRTHSLRGKRVGLHGFGAIARELVQMLKPHHVHLSSYSAPVPRSFMEAHGVVYCSSIEELFSQSDILIECESLTAESEGSVNERILRLLPDDAVFVNIARALLTDEAALIRIAQEKRLRVAVDVYGTEPLEADSPWLSTPTAFISPHVAGPTADTYPFCGKRALENVARSTRGEAVQEAMSLQVYDVST